MRDESAANRMSSPGRLRPSGALKIPPGRTSFRRPWQNGIAERWVGSCRRDLLDQTIALKERHLKRLLSEYVRYHHEERTHLGLEKGRPDGRIRSVASGRVLQRSDSAGCTIVTIELPSSDRLAAHPLYICALHAQTGPCPPNSSRSVEARIGFRPSLPRKVPYFISAEVLANHRAAN